MKIVSFHSRFDKISKYFSLHYYDYLFKINTGQAGTENTQPLPNPWGSSQSSTTPASTGSSTSNPTGANTLPNMSNIFAQLMGGGGGAGTTTTSTSTSTTTPTAPTGGTQRPNANNLFNSSTIQDLMQNMLRNPGQLESMLNAPHMQPMLESIASNPEMSRLLVDNNPQLAGNPELREQVLRALPTMMNQVSKS